MAGPSKAGAKVRFKDLCAEDKAKLAKLIAKVASIHADPRIPEDGGGPNHGNLQDSVVDDNDKNVARAVDSELAKELATLKDQVKVKDEAISKLLKEVENYKHKFSQSLNIVKQVSARYKATICPSLL